MRAVELRLQNWRPISEASMGHDPRHYDKVALQSNIDMWRRAYRPVFCTPTMYDHQNGDYGSFYESYYESLGIRESCNNK
jgi:hypothetical protein